MSDEQRLALQQRPDAPLFVLDEATQARYVLVPAGAYQRARALFEEDEFDVREMYPLIDEVAG